MSLEPSHTDVAQFPIQKVKVHAQVNEPLVALLETLLSDAKKGDLQAMAVATVHADDLEPGGPTGAKWHLAPGTRYAMSHALGILNRHLGRVLHEA